MRGNLSAKSSPLSAAATAGTSVRTTDISRKTLAERLAASPRWAPKPLLLIVIVGVGLRAFRLGHQSLWTDEIVTALSSTGSIWWVVTQTTVNSNIPPLYYVLVRLVMPLGRHEWVIRLPSMLFGAASVALFYLVIRPWLGPRVALLCAATLAISPFHVWYRHGARPHGLSL